MQIEEYLKKHQPIIYQTFSNTLTGNSLSHAYLLVGDSGTPLLDTAIYIAKSILCDDAHPFACNKCITCTRIDDGNYPDFIVLDGSKGTIKKENILSLESNFDKTAFESKGKKIYVIHLVETINDNAINSILKFLEEPGSEIYAFLTTNNIANVLPTIVSRCQTLRLKPVDRNEIINDAISLGVPQEDAELLSYFYNDPDLLKKAFNEDKDYLLAKEAILDLIDALKSNHDEAFFIAETKVVPLLDSKEAARFFFDMLIELFEDIESSIHSNPIYLNSINDKIDELSHVLKHVDETLVEILKSRGSISLNANIPLLIDHIMLTIGKEEL